MIRKFQDTDLNAVADIWLDTNRKAHDFIPVQYWEDRFGMVKEMLPQAEIYVYEGKLAGQILGFIGLTDHYIEGIFVRSEVQSEGIGKQLIDFVKRIKKVLSLNVYQKNVRAIKFYQREGFQIQNEAVEEDTGEAEYGMVWKRDYHHEKDGFILRLAREEDAERYYEQNYSPLDKEVVRFTGSREQFTREEVISFFLKSIEDSDRYFFLIIAPNGRIIGESVINEIDWDSRCANFRIAIFSSAERGKGIGTWVTKATCDFAFSELKLHRLELDVYSFNSRAERMYLKVGFKKEGIRREAVMIENRYVDDIIMALLETDWKGY